MYLEKIYQILPMNLMNCYMLTMLSVISIMSSMNFISKVNKEKSKKTYKIKKMKILFLSLFISFDPKGSVNLIFLKELNWTIMLFFLPLTFYTFWSKQNRILTIKMNLLKLINQQFEIALKSKKDSTKLIFSSIFIFILMCNLIGLIPNSFTSTSHINMNLFISFPMWMGTFMFGWIIYTNKMLTHLVPSGTPFPLISFMVLIELISTLIRPLTLSIRLMANMVSGHLLLTLMGNSMENFNLIMIIILSLIQNMLFSLEMSVSMIQAYVFCMLLTLYSNDSDFSN